MALTILVRSADTEVPPSLTFDAPRVVIGRGEGCEVRLPDPSVSHRHASIRQRGTEFIVVDEGSTNGTFVGPVRLSPQTPRMLRSGDVLRVGRVKLEVRLEQVPATAHAQLATKEIALRLVASALAAEGQTAAPRVRVVRGPDQGKELDLDAFERAYVVGRGTSCDLQLTDTDTSRRHVQLARRGAQIFVRDLGAKNGSELGQSRLEPDRDTVWKQGASLRVGATELVFEDPVVQALAELERAADELVTADELDDAEELVAAPEEGLAEEPPQAAGGDGTSAPVAELPRAARRPPRRSTLQLTDLLVALLALVVLGLSVLGLAWLFGTH